MEWAADLGTAAVGALTCAATGLLVPHIVERVPEPEPGAAGASGGTAHGPAPGATEGITHPEPRIEGSSEREPPPKESYTAIAGLPWLTRASVLVGAVSGFLIGLGVGWDWALVVALALVPCATALAVIDLRTRLLPTWLIVRTFAMVAVLGLLAVALTQDWDDVTRALIGMVGAFSFYALLWFIYPQGMGYGDVRLAGLLGLATAYFGWPQFIVGMYVSFPLFAVPGVLVALVRWDRSFLRTAFPFGPSMIAGALIGISLGIPVLAGLVGT